MSITLKTCYSCGRILQGSLNNDKKGPSLTGECWKCKEKRERNDKGDKDNG